MLFLSRDSRGIGTMVRQDCERQQQHGTDSVVSFSIATEIRERPKTATASGAKGGDGGGGSSGPDLLAETLELDSDDALSDLIDSDVRDVCSCSCVVRGSTNSRGVFSCWFNRTAVGSSIFESPSFVKSKRVLVSRSPSVWMLL